MTIRISLAALAACFVFAASAHAQSGSIFAGAPLDGPKVWPVSSFVPTGQQTFADAAIVRDRAIQGALKTNIIRALEPGFDVTGDVTIVDGPQTGGFIGLFKRQVMLSVPVRFHAVATLEGDFRFEGKWYGRPVILSLSKGTMMYKRFLPTESRGSFEDWCGTGVMQTGDKSTPAPVCFARTLAGHTIVYAGDTGYGKGEPFFRAPGVNQVQFYNYHGAYPAMTPAEAPSGMTAELTAIPLPAQTTFVWVLRKGPEEEATVGYANSSPDNAATGIGPYQVLRMAWVDLVFKMENHRLNYVGFVDVLDGHPELTEKARIYDLQTPYSPPPASEAWTLGALEFDRDSLNFTTTPTEATLGLKAHVRGKVRLLEGRKEGNISVEPGDIFYATKFEGEDISGELSSSAGWCGRMRKPVWYGGDFQSNWMACFMPGRPETATLYKYTPGWEVAAGVWSTDITESTGTLFSPTLPRFEPAPAGPEDDRDVVIHLRRDRKDDQVAQVAMAFRSNGKETEQRTWVLHFDADGVGRLNLWTKALVVKRDGDGLKVEMTDGDGRGFRPVY